MMNWWGCYRLHLGGRLTSPLKNRPINFPPKGNDLYVGGGNSNIFYFHSDPWGNDPIWQAYFSNGLVQPPTRYCIPTMPFFRLQTCCSFTRVPGISFWELREFPTETEQCQDNQLGSGGFEMPFNQVIKLHLESPGVYIIYDNYMIITWPPEKWVGWKTGRWLFLLKDVCFSQGAYVELPGR